MAQFKSFEEIESWRLGRQITVEVYKITNQGDFSRDFGLRDQLRRAVVSITSNIAEGFERDGNREFINFLSIAKGSCGEARSQLYVALDLGYLTREQFDPLFAKLVSTSRLINGLMEYLKDAEAKGRKFR